MMPLTSNSIYKHCPANVSGCIWNKNGYLFTNPGMLEIKCYSPSCIIQINFL